MRASCSINEADRSREIVLVFEEAEFHGALRGMWERFPSGMPVSHQLRYLSRIASLIEARVEDEDSPVVVDCGGKVG